MKISKKEYDELIKQLKDKDKELQRRYEIYQACLEIQDWVIERYGH